MSIPIQEVLCIHGLIDRGNCPDCQKAMARLQAQAHRTSPRPRKAQRKSQPVAGPAPRPTSQQVKPASPEVIAAARAAAEQATLNARRASRERELAALKARNERLRQVYRSIADEQLSGISGEFKP